MKKFKKIYIEITNVCNLACSFCPKTHRKPEFMDTELFCRILSEIQGYTKHVYFHVLGEPLLHPQLKNFLDISGEFGIKVNITTNGTLIYNKKEELLNSTSLRQVNFSLHSFEADRESCGAKEYLDGIFDFIDTARNKSSVFISLRLWNLKEGFQNEENTRILKRIESYFNLPFPVEDLLEAASINGIKLSDRIYLNQAHTFKWPVQSGDMGENRGFCHGLRDQAAILADGTVVPCCLDSEGIINLGNIKNQSFKSIIEGERAQRIYSFFSERNVAEPLCQKCTYRRRFN